MTMKCDEYVWLWLITFACMLYGKKHTANANCTHIALYTAFLYRAMFRAFDWLAS